jgi:hypothetical protein
LRLSGLHRSALLLAPALVVVAGCGGRVTASGASAALSIHAAALRIDTNRSTRFSATTANGEPAKVEWSVTGGDPTAGAGKIDADGLYTPPGYLTEDAVTVSVSAAPAGTGKTPPTTASAELIVTPGFLQPLTPGNLSLGPNGTVTISGSMTEVGGDGEIRFSLATDAAGTAGGPGSLSVPQCVRSSIKGANPAYTVCSVTYTAPQAIPVSGSVFIVGAVTSRLGADAKTSWTRILLNSSGINSNPSAHQAHLAVPVLLGSSSGNNSDYDSSLGQLSDCCGGTLGALLQDTSGTQYVLSNNHVLARSDQSLTGETIIQPGLIDNGCTPYGYGPGTTPVATLTGYPALSSSATNVDAAIARVAPGAVDPRGNILELGARQPDGTLAAAPPGISSSGGKGETASLGMMVAKSGRTTGLTCAAVSAINVDVVVDYYTDCAETAHAMTKTFTNQIAIAGTSFSDAGDSGALLVNAANAEPVGLFYAGGTDAQGVEHAIANPVGDVLAALDAFVPGASGQTAYGFVGGADHPVACLSYGAGNESAPDRGAAGVEDLSAKKAAAGLSSSERELAEGALPLAQLLPGISPGVTRTAVAASKDHPGGAAIALYVDSAVNVRENLPATIGGVPTVVVSPAIANAQPRAASLNQAIVAKQKNAPTLMAANPAIFGVGVGQSLDNPADAALILFVDRKKAAGKLPQSVDGQRVRVVLMDRLHVTRAHGQAGRVGGTCLAAPEAQHGAGLDWSPELLPRQIQLPN